MTRPHKTARFERQIVSLVVARSRRVSLSVAEAARLALRLRESLDEPGAEAPASPSDAAPVPQVPIEESVRPGYLVCLETGKRLVLLRRHLKERLRMTPEQYRTKWGLPPDYPMVAEAYLRTRAESRGEAQG